MAPSEASHGTERSVKPTTPMMVEANRPVPLCNTIKAQSNAQSMQEIELLF
jgi:hypothetical protein